MTLWTPANLASGTLEAWFDASERYPRQLHEMDRGAYLAMKRGESDQHVSLQ